MNKVELEQSPKDVTFPSKQAKLIKIFKMTNRFLNKIRWAAYWFEKKKNEAKNKTLEVTD